MSNFVFWLCESSRDGLGLVMSSLGSDRLTISAAIFDDTVERFRGHVDVFDPDKGVEGWAFNIDSPQDPLELELRAGDHVVATCTTGGQRADIAALLGCDARPGFQLFSDEAFERLLRLGRGGNADPIVVGIAGTHLVLPASTALTPVELFRKCIGDSAPGLTADFSLLVRLSALRSEAAELSSKPLRALVDRMVGIVEAVAIDADGCTWIIGWMRRQAIVDCPAVIVDRQKAPAGLAFSMFERPDLDSESCGIIGIVYSNWRPTNGAGVLFYIGADVRLYLRSTEPLRVIPMVDFAEHFAEIAPNCFKGHTTALRLLIDRPASWALSSTNNGPHARASLDQVLVLPNFGAIVSGWALSPAKRIAGFAMRMGSCILASDPDTLFFQARPDLADVFPGSDQLIQSGGFVAAFRGALTELDLNASVLKVIYVDGTTTNHAVEARVIRRLGHSVSLEAASNLYPSLDSELFFPDFAAALRADASSAIQAARPYIISQASRIVVLTVPNDRSDMFLLFTEVANELRGQRYPPGIAFIAGSTRLRPEVVSLFQSLQSTVLTRLSLTFVDDSSYALHALPSLLSCVGAAHFAFVAAHVLLTRAGWRAAVEALACKDDDLTFLGICDAADPEADSAKSAECFAWSSHAFASWFAGAPVYVNGYYNDNGLAGIGRSSRTYEKCGLRLGSPGTLPLVDAVNRLAAQR